MSCNNFLSYIPTYDELDGNGDDDHRSVAIEENARGGRPIVTERCDRVVQFRSFFFFFFFFFLFFFFEGDI